MLWSSSNSVQKNSVPACYKLVFKTQKSACIALKPFPLLLPFPMRWKLLGHNMYCDAPQVIKKKHDTTKPRFFPSLAHGQVLVENVQVWAVAVLTQNLVGVGNVIMG